MQRVVRPCRFHTSNRHGGRVSAGSGSWYHAPAQVARRRPRAPIRLRRSHRRRSSPHHSSRGSVVTKRVISTPAAPAAIGPYSQAIAVGGLLFTAGQIALDPATMTVVPGDVSAQTEQVMKNLAAICAEAGASLQQVVKTTVFLQDMSDFQAMNEVYARHFGENRPARSTVAVRGLPRDVRVEIEAIVSLPGA
ncbi:MAG: RidA family protein [Gemmatimonadaceae bacterium]|nr:RidA family protein [Gemmatimonadaceae bacterium]